jgi:transcriptional regulator MftR-like protein
MAAMKPLSPSPCTVGGSRTTEERTLWEARESVICAVASRARGPPSRCAGTEPGANLQEFLVSAVASAPGSAAPIEAVAAALEGAGALLLERRDYARRRQAVIAANPGLQERELIKLASLASALATALRQRGVTGPAASLAAEAGIAVFKIAFEHWVGGTSQPDLPQLIRESFNDLKAVTAGK